MKPDSTLNVAGIVLAAGASTRMGSGTNKLLLHVGGEPMIRRTVGRAMAGGLAHVVVVVGHDAPRIRSALHGVDCTFIENPNPLAPSSASLHAALRAIDHPPHRGQSRLGSESIGVRVDRGQSQTAAGAVDAAVDAAAVMLGDMVHVTSGMIGALVNSASESAAPLAVSRYGDVFAPPLLFRRALWPELLAWNGEGCGKSVVMAHRDEAVIIDWPAQALRDVDTLEDYLAVTTPEV